MTAFKITNGTVSRPTFSSQAARVAYRRANRLCTQCGIELEEIEGAKCDRCCATAAKRQKRYRAKLPDKGYARTKADRAAHPEKWKQRRLDAYDKSKQSKICTKCSNEALEDSNLCHKHTAKHRRYARLYYHKTGRVRRQLERAKAA